MVGTKSVNTLQVLKWLWWSGITCNLHHKYPTFFCLYIMHFAPRETKLQFLALRKKAVSKWA